MVRESNQLQARLRTGRLSQVARCDLRVEGDVRRGLTFWVGEASADSYRAAAQLVLSQWQVGLRGHLDVTELAVGIGGTDPSALQRLYLRSLLIRRLNAHIDACVGLKARRRRADE